MTSTTKEINFDDVEIHVYNKRGEEVDKSILDALLPLFEEAYKEMGDSVGKFDFDSEYTKSFAETAFFNNHNSFILLVVYKEEIVGVFGGMLVPNMFSKATVATESFMYLKKPFRCGIIGKHMVRLFEEWASTKGASSVIFSSPMKDFSLEPLMKRYGYDRFELSFKKELK